jgi:hypothetical protein
MAEKYAFVSAARRWYGTQSDASVYRFLNLQRPIVRISGFFASNLIEPRS